MSQAARGVIPAPFGFGGGHFFARKLSCPARQRGADIMHIARAATLAATITLLGSSAAWSQSGRTLDTFVAEANRVPLNPTAMLRSDARRLAREANAAFAAIGGEVRAARAGGQAPLTCPPARISVDPRQMLDFLNAIPPAGRARMTPTDGIRAWMASRYPCPLA